VGWLDGEIDTPAERVRFFIDRNDRARPAESEARLDVCSSLNER
jgi:hypothetical protein